MTTFDRAAGRWPPDGTPPDTLHWLYRSTGAPHWMVATWTGEAWETLRGRVTAPERLTWWRYVCPAHPPVAEAVARRLMTQQQIEAAEQHDLDATNWDAGELGARIGELCLVEDPSVAVMACLRVAAVLAIGRRVEIPIPELREVMCTSLGELINGLGEAMAAEDAA